jgi:hypothetical protein
LTQLRNEALTDCSSGSGYEDVHRLSPSLSRVHL